MLPSVAPVVRVVITLRVSNRWNYSTEKVSTETDAYIATEFPDEKMGSISRQCGIKNSGQASYSESYFAYSTNIITIPNRPDGRACPRYGEKSQTRSGRKQMAPDELRTLKMRTNCTV